MAGQSRLERPPYQASHGVSPGAVPDFRMEVLSRGLSGQPVGGVGMWRAEGNGGWRWVEGGHLDARPRHGQRRPAGVLPSVPVGMVVTRAPGLAPCAAPWAWGGGCGAVKPRALRTSTSSLVVTSLLSFRNWRAFSRPCPIRSPL